MSADNIFFLEILEWFDNTGSDMVYRLPENGSGDIKYGAQLIVRDTQAAVFYYNGRAIEVFGPGKHTLKTENIPVLTKLLSFPWGFESPLRAEVYFINLKTFTDFKWGTRDPVAFKDSELGLVRLRAYGSFNIRIVQPMLLVNTLVGTQQFMRSEDMATYLNNVIVSRFNDYLGEHLDSLLNLPGKYDALADGLVERVQEDFVNFGLSLTQLLINAITPPPEVQSAIDDRSKLGLFKDLDKLMKLKTAMALEKAAESDGQNGIAMGLGMMMPALTQRAPAEHKQTSCKTCDAGIPRDAKFCNYCGEQQLVFLQCQECHQNLPPEARFCSKCGLSTEQNVLSDQCRSCGAKGLGSSVFCNQCGEKF